MPRLSSLSIATPHVWHVGYTPTWPTTFVHHTEWAIFWCFAFYKFFDPFKILTTPHINTANSALLLVSLFSFAQIENATNNWTSSKSSLAIFLACWATVVLGIWTFANACLYSGHIISATFKRDFFYKLVICKKLMMSKQFFHLIKNFISQQLIYFILMQKTNAAISSLH